MPKKQTKLKVGLVTESNAKYHGDKSAVSKSQLARMSVCPKFFKWAEDNPQEQSDEMIVGSAFHKIVLEPKTFDKEFVVMPPIDKRTKAGKEAYEEFLKTAGNRQVITQEQYDTICGMRDSVLSNRYAVELLKGIHEKSMYGVDELTRERIKTRPDCYLIIDEVVDIVPQHYENLYDDYGEPILNADGTNAIKLVAEERKVRPKQVLITDLKSCRSALYDDFCRDVVKYSYDLQAYMYSMNASKVLGVPMENISFVFIAVEKKAPYLVNILQVDEFVLQRGEALFKEYIGTYKECQEKDNWWGLNGSSGYINNLSLPSYLVKNIEN